MSAPVQQSPSHSPTPSKSSLRRTSGAQNPSQRSLLPPPSPRFEDTSLPIRYSPRSPPNQTLEYNSEEEDAVSDEEDPGHAGQEYYTGDEQLKRPFQPFFTLIEDTLTSEHHHPSVHYIFADDEHDIITEAALRSLEQDELEESSATAQDTNRDDLLHRTTPGVKEHYLILDVQPILQQDVQSAIQADDSMPRALQQGYVVSGVTSLSPDWQIQSSIISAAPTIGHSDDETEDGLMLRIAGRGCTIDDDQNKSTDEPIEKESVEEMIDRLQQRIMEVKILMETDEDIEIEERDVGANFEEQD